MCKIVMERFEPPAPVQVCLAFLVTAFALTLWGMRSDHALGRGWMTGLVFALLAIGAATTGPVFLGNAVSDQNQR